MNKEIILTNKAPMPVGPYSQAILADNRFLFLSGQIPLDNNGNIVGADIKTQTHQVIKNIQAVLEKAGASLNSVVKSTVFLKDMNNFTEMNEVYSQYFISLPPARSTIQVARLPKDALIEIEVVAVI